MVGMEPMGRCGETADTWLRLGFHHRNIQAHKGMEVVGLRGGQENIPGTRLRQW